MDQKTAGTSASHEKGFIVSIDQGTTSSRALVIDHDLRVVGSASREHDQISPKPGWVEHNPEQIMGNIVECLTEVCQKYNLNSSNVKSIGITNQRETTIAMDRSTGKSLHNGIVWLDQRTAGIVDQMKKKNGGNADAYRLECGLPINTYFSAQKMRWLMENVDGLTQNPNLCFTTVDAYLIANLTNCEQILTDSSNAGRTMLMDINKLEWSDKMLSEYEINRSWLPDIRQKSSDNFGQIKHPGLKMLEGVPIGGNLGDQHAACLGHVLREGQVKNTYGTGCFLLQNTGSNIIQSKHGLLTTLCYNLDGKPNYALEGAVEIAGAAIHWAKSIGFIKETKTLEAMASSVPDCGDVYFVPAFQGIFSPYWRDDARGLWIGLGSNTTQAHMVRSMLEAPCLRTCEVIDSMSIDSGKPVDKMAVDGGMTVNNLMMQLQANFANATIVRKQEQEITGIGAAIAAGLHVNFWDSLEEVEHKVKVEREFSPEATYTADMRQKKRNRWKQAVERSIGFGWEEEK